MPGHVNEGLWSKAKAMIHKSHPGMSEKDDSFWAMVTSTYKSMGGKFHKKTAYRSLVKDFTAGVDPTGATTFGYGLDDTRRRIGAQKHLRKGVGMVGGALGGALIVPSAISGLVYAGKALLSKGRAGGLRNVGRELVKGFKEPFSSVADAVRLNRYMKRAPIAANRSGLRRLFSRNTASVLARPNKAEMNAIERTLARQGVTRDIYSGIAKNKTLKGLNEQEFTKALRTNAGFRGHLGRLINERKNMALAGFGIGGGINSLSAMLQYNKGVDAVREKRLRRI